MSKVVINGPKTGIKWLKDNYLTEIEEALKGTPFPARLAFAIAYQETGYIWSTLVNKGLSKERVLELCIGDTIDAPNRSAFPKTATILRNTIVEKNGNKYSGSEMFKIGRATLMDMIQYVPGYEYTKKQKDEFCHGYGIFQYDIQFFKINPEFFLQRKWCNFSECLKLLVSELHAASGRNGWKNKTSFTESELIYTAIAYNRGRADLKKGFAQGHKNSEGVYYGQNIEKYLKLF
jgi:hypothetical protein